jgi:DNA modification methylase
VRLLAGDCLERMRELDDGSIDSVVTDPPYGIGFMGREWDSFAPDRVAARATSLARKETFRTSEKWPSKNGKRARQNGGVAVEYDRSSDANRLFQEWCEAWGGECLRVLKPGGHLVSFGGTRTYHRLAAGVEDAGFEIRDQLAWLFGQGFPKSRDLGEGRGTALKPGHEPIVLARKPCDGSASANVAVHGTGGLNIEACGIAIEDRDTYERNCSGDRGHAGTRDREARGATDLRPGGGSAAGERWPANVLLDEDAAAMLDEHSGELVSGANPTRRGSDKFRDVYGDFAGQVECEPRRGVDTGGASRFFYCAKVSARERHAGLEPSLLTPPGAPERSDHPTVKPLALMRWLVRLVTPEDGLVLDPFLGSGTTAAAAALEGRRFVGIEREPAYVAS